MVYLDPVTPRQSSFITIIIVIIYPDALNLAHTRKVVHITHLAQAAVDIKS